MVLIFHGIYFPIQNATFSVISCRIQRFSCHLYVAKLNMIRSSQAATRSLADHVYDSSPSQAQTPRHACLPSRARASRWVPPVVSVRVGPPAKRRRRETMTSQFAESDDASGDSFHIPNSAAYYTPPDARSLPSADGPLGPLQSQLAASSPRRTGCGNSQVAFSRGHTQRAFRHA